jgi:hypothetical protein
MTYYPDLSNYTFLKDTIPADVTALNIGWLDENHHFQRGDVEDSFIRDLFLLSKEHVTARTRGYHACPFCRRAGIQEYPISASYGGETVLLGSAEVRVLGIKRTWLIAPDLVLHYVQVHGYRPPEAFVLAVERGQLAGGSYVR